MKQIDLFNIKLNHIRIFLTAVEFGSFSKTAGALHVTQPMVTKTIQTLENELDLILFLRNKGRVTLTPAGRELYVQWKNLLQYFENSIEDASAQQEGVITRFVIGTGYLMPPGHMRRIREGAKKLEKNIKVHFESLPMNAAWERLQKRELDAVLISGHILPEEKGGGLDWEVINPSCLAIYVPHANPLSQRESIKFADLKEEKFIAYSSDTDSKYISLLNRLAAEAGFTPQIACYVPDESSFEINLWLNNGVVLADGSMKMDEGAAKCFLLPEEENNLYLVWRTDWSENKQKELDKVIRTFLTAF